LHKDKLFHPLESVNSFYLGKSVVEVKLMDAQCGTPSAPIELPIEKAKNGRPTQYDEKLGAKIIDAVRSGFTLERAAEYVGINSGTAQGWVTKRQDFGRLIKKARREHEMSLLRSVELAGEKSWQARAWILERTHGYAQPSARLNVTQDVTHGISGNLASLLAGIAMKKKITATPEKRQIESSHNYIDIQPVATKPENDLSNNKYCINKSNIVEQQQDATPKTPKLRHKRMKLRKPRAESLAKYPPTTTPPATPPAPV
jgi:hypothetical protein